MPEQDPHGTSPWWSEPFLPPAEPARGYGLPADEVIGRTGQPSTTVLLLVVALVAALVGGGVGGVVGALVGRHEGRALTAVTDPNVTLPAAQPVAAGPVPAGSVTAIAARLVPSVVTIQVRAAGVQGTGAGVIIRSDGYVLTNNHVVALAVGGGQLTVDFSNGLVAVPARIVGRDPLDDLAVVKVAETGLRAATLGHSSTLQVGQLVVAVGAPLGLSGSVTSGIVSALNRNIEVPRPDDPQQATVLADAIQTDASINPGNSGGALADGNGDVVGINAAIASTGSTSGAVEAGSIGVGFAIPIDLARLVAEELIRTGRVTHPYIGVVPETVDPSTAPPGAPRSGAYLRQVQAGTPAAAAGLRVGDVIVALDGQPVTSADDLIAATRAHRIGERVTLTFFRGGDRRTVALVLATNPQG